MRHAGEPAEVEDYPGMAGGHGAVLGEADDENCKAGDELLVAEADDDVDQVVYPSGVVLFCVEMDLFGEPA